MWYVSAVGEGKRVSFASRNSFLCERGTLFLLCGSPPPSFFPLYNILAASVVCVEPSPSPTQPLSASHAQSVIAGCPGPRGRESRGGGLSQCAQKKQLSRG